MRRTQFPNINLIRKIAWSFHKSTHLEFDDLFQEAAIAYHVALKSYDPAKGKITTFATHCILSHLKNYTRKELKVHGWLEHIDDDWFWEVLPARPTSHIFEDLPTGSSKMISKITEENWTWAEVWKNIHAIKASFCNI